MLYGRTDELNKLNDYYNGVGNSFIMLYGRSNIGKTALLREFIKDKKHFIIMQHWHLKRSRQNFLPCI